MGLKRSFFRRADFFRSGLSTPLVPLLFLLEYYSTLRPHSRQEFDFDITRNEKDTQHGLRTRCPEQDANEPMPRGVAVAVVVDATVNKEEDCTIAAAALLAAKRRAKAMCAEAGVLEAAKAMAGAAAAAAAPTRCCRCGEGVKVLRIRRRRRKEAKNEERACFPWPSLERRRTNFGVRSNASTRTTSFGRERGSALRPPRTPLFSLSRVLEQA